MIHDKQPLVSVIIPAYKAEAWIELTLRSALAQTYRQLEVIVVDDGSPDETARLVEQIAADDARMKLVRQANGGLANARNAAIAHSTGRLVAPLDADDLWHPDKIEKQVACFLAAEERGESVGLVYCWSQDIDEDSHIIEKGADRVPQIGNVLEALVRENFIGNGSSPLISMNALSAVGNYSEEAAFGCEDWVLYVQIASRFYIDAVPEYLVGYRQLSSSMSANFEKMVSGHKQATKLIKRDIPSLDAALLRDAHTTILLWLLSKPRPFSKEFFSLLKQVFAHDPFAPFRKVTLVRLYGIFCACLRRLRSIGAPARSGGESEVFLP